MGMHNYYQKATHISCHLSKTQNELRKVIENRLHPTRKGKITEKGHQRYSESKQIRYLEGEPILPLSKVETKVPDGRPAQANIYTGEGVDWLQHHMNPPILLIQGDMLKHPIRNRSIEYNDNRISLVSGQQGKDKITGRPLEEEWVDCHHIKPRSQGGDDSYWNLILVHSAIHELIQMTDEETIEMYLKEQDLDEEQIKKLNKYRKKIGKNELKVNHGENSK